MRVRDLCLLVCSLALVVCARGLASSSSFGSSAAGNCYQASLSPRSNHGIRYCDDAIGRGNLSKSDLASTYSNRGILHLRNGHIKKALKDHERAIHLLPGLPQLHTNRGNALYYNHDYEGALLAYNKAINSDVVTESTLNITLYNKVLALLELRRVAEAKTTLLQALITNPGSKRIRDKLADIASLDENP